MTQTTLTGGRVKKIIKGACEKRENGQICGGDLEEFGKQLDDNKPDQFKCLKCRKLTIIEVLQ
ncbi:hypothetical protein [Methanobacterium sp.]|uniref:hypothetical protein n=1 Tax=Methanobacterium sp. TaxID=2164 RepID=UPI003C72300C